MNEFKQTVNDFKTVKEIVDTKYNGDFRKATDEELVAYDYCYKKSMRLYNESKDMRKIEKSKTLSKVVNGVLKFAELTSKDMKVVRKEMKKRGLRYEAAN